MTTKKRIISIAVSAVLAVAVLYMSTLLLMPKYMENSNEGALIAEYYDEADKQNKHDVIFVGDCEVYESFVPPVLWNEYGISSYIRGSAQQLVWQSYYLLEETFKYEKPKIVVFNVLSLKYGKPQNEAYNRMTLDGMRQSYIKTKAVKASMTDEENFLTYIFPLFRFHSRWSKISSEDFKYMFKRDRVSHNGYLMQTGIVPKTSDRTGEELMDYKLPDVGFEYLNKMNELCKLNDAELILIKSPTNTWKYWWYDEWDRQVSEYAEQNDIDYYNFIDDENLDIDWSADTYDGGIHLNVYGAEKLTDYFGNILSEKYKVSDKRNDKNISEIWNEKYNNYMNAKKESEKKQ